MKLALSLAAGSAMLASSVGMMANPQSFLVELEGGCAETFTAVGNAFNHYFLGPDNLAFAKANGKMHFILEGNRVSSESVTCAQRRPSRGTPARPSQRLPDDESLTGGPETFAAKQAKSGRRLASQTTQSLRNLVLMVRWSDHNDTTVPSVSDFEVLFNNQSPDPVLAPTETVKTFYKKNSHDLLDINNVLSGWIDVDYTEAQAAGPCFEDGCCNGGCGAGEKLRIAIIEALIKYESNIGAEAFALFDEDEDGFVDMLTVVHSGKGAEHTGGEGVGQFWIWSHKYVLDEFQGLPIVMPLSGVKLSNYNINPGLWHVGNDTSTNEDVIITRIGVIVHEMGHFLGLLDHYDTDYSSYGIGPYGLMANSWGLDGSQKYPPSLSAPSKNLLGWISTQDLLKRADLPIGPVSYSAVFPLEDIHESATAYTIELSQSEYYMIENRQNRSTDALHRGGILVWHVDETKFATTSNTQEFNVSAPESWATNHPAVRLVQPDFEYNLEEWVAKFPGVRLGDPAGMWFPYNDVSLTDELPVNINLYSKLGMASGISLSEFSNSSDVMTFRFSFDSRAVAPEITAAPTPEVTTVPTAAPAVKSSRTTVPVPVVAGVGVGGILFGALLSTIFFCLCRPRAEKDYEVGVPNPAHSGGPVSKMV